MRLSRPSSMAYRRVFISLFGLLTAVLVTTTAAILAGALVGLWRHYDSGFAGMLDGIGQRWWPRFQDFSVWGSCVSGLLLWAAAVRIERALPSRGNDPVKLTPASWSGAQPEVPLRLLVLQGELRGLADNTENVAPLLDALVRGAGEQRASDIHMQPAAEFGTIALRVDGQLQQVLRVSPSVHRGLMTRLKVVADLKTYVSDRSQDGQLRLSTEHGDLEGRVSLLPTRHGERAALRFVQAAHSLPPLEELGLPPSGAAALSRALGQSRGLVLLTGPTGSGKTTTIYTALARIHQDRGQAVHIATIEDPIERELPFVAQTQVQPERGLTFAGGLRSLLRQDPDVLMVGEIRDTETGKIAVQAGLTGHLILTSVHADCAAGVFNRLIDLDIEPFLVASASLIVVSQRLVRRLCPSCRRPVELTEVQSDELARLGVAPPPRLYDASGCDACAGLGYRGRAGIFEVLTVTDRIREIIVQCVPTPTLHRVAIEEGTTPVLEHGLQRVGAGDASLADVLRVAGAA